MVAVRVLSLVAVVWLGSLVGGSFALGADPAGLARRVGLPEGRKLYLVCRGRGSPTVILESGFRDDADIWIKRAESTQQRTVFPVVASFTRVCAYDRPGTTFGADGRSRSSPVRMPRTARDAVADLHALIIAARLSGPFVLVGHSTGGLIVRLYTSAYPGEVSGMVLVDAIPETIASSLSVSQWNEYNARYLTAPPPALAGYADLEMFDFTKSFEQMRKRPRPPRRIPLIVLSHGQPFGIPPPLGPAVERAWAKGQRYLASLEPGTRQIVATNSGHYIQVEDPRLVINEIRRVVAAARDRRQSTG
jgi:pimeloyl-ACP methyl ester carboxylesterase